MGEGKETRLQKDPLALPPASSQMKAFALGVFFLLGFGLGAFIFWNPFSVPWLPGGAEEHTQKHAHGPKGEDVDRQLWTCPMHPEVMEEEPGDCPICHMKLVQMEGRKGDMGEQGALEIDPAIVQKIGVRSEEVKIAAYTVVLGSRDNTGAGANLSASHVGVQKPLLGRYQFDREIGRGAMGLV